jgi:hypothetical protein
MSKKLPKLSASARRLIEAQAVAMSYTERHTPPKGSSSSAKAAAVLSTSASLPSLRGPKRVGWSDKAVADEPAITVDLFKPTAPEEILQQARMIIARSQPKLEAAERDLDGREEALEECRKGLRNCDRLIQDARYRIEERGIQLEACKKSPGGRSYMKPHMMSNIDAQRAAVEALRRTLMMRTLPEVAATPSKVVPEDEEADDDDEEAMSVDELLPSNDSVLHQKKTFQETAQSTSKSRGSMSSTEAAEWNPKDCLRRRSLAPGLLLSAGPSDWSPKDISSISSNSRASISMSCTPAATDSRRRSVAPGLLPSPGSAEWHPNECFRRRSLATSLVF